MNAPGLSPFEWFSVGVVVVGALAWLLRLESAQKSHAQRHDDYVKAHEALHAEVATNLNQRFDTFGKTLDRIEGKMDAALVAAVKEK